MKNYSYLFLFGEDKNSVLYQEHISVSLCIPFHFPGESRKFIGLMGGKKLLVLFIP